ncbi:MAG: hypothetical protein GW917_01725 [Bdellovibrionales bacterium]|nr:hypothetical protein [Bdellovibrionales bacterium]
MGRENWQPSNDDSGWELRYFDLCSRYCDDSEEDAEFPWEGAWDLFVQEIAESLPPSFCLIKERIRRGYLPRAHYNSDDVVIAVNGLVAVVVDGQAEYDHVGLAVVVLDPCANTRGLAECYVSSFAPRLWKALGGQQRTRLGPWTTMLVR